MNRPQLVDAIREKHPNLSTAQVTAVIESAFAIITETLVKQEPVKIHNFGTFAVAHRQARMGRNPNTGEPLPIAAKNVIDFSSYEALAQAINQTEE